MNEQTAIPPEKVDALYEQLDQEAEASGYHLNPEREFVRGLVEGLLINEQRYGYRACPCRLATGDGQKDLDIVCPCDYRDADLLEWGNCYCALYVSDEVLRGEREAQPILERRPPEGQRAQDLLARPPESPLDAPGTGAESVALRTGAESIIPPLPVWRCRVCGYLCAREKPPAICPICKARQERFERFW